MIVSSLSKSIFLKHRTFRICYNNFQFALQNANSSISIGGNLLLAYRKSSTTSPFLVFNSLRKALEPLRCRLPSILTWYACGPTVYDETHLGHARAYVCQDIIRRILLYYGINVIQVMNITDIDDKILKQASLRNTDPASIARYYEKDFFDALRKLNVIPATIVARVTDYIPDIIEFISLLIEKKYAYSTSMNNVYFDIAQYQSAHKYGVLQPSQLEDEVEKLTDKKDRRDFALWKNDKHSSFSWPSRWGFGRPGWHIECSTIATKIFGPHLDLHSGGIDLQFPHHENEIAQCNAFHGSEWCGQFLHVGHLHIEGRKMSKSLKNFITVREMLEESLISARQFRLFCLSSHYRSDIEYKQQTVANIKVAEKRIQDFLLRIKMSVEQNSIDQCTTDTFRDTFDCNLVSRLTKCNESIEIALKNDFDTPAVLAIIQDEITFANTLSEDTFPTASSLYHKELCELIVKVFIMFGINFEQDKASGKVEERVLSLVSNFRSDLRQMALANLKIDEKIKPERLLSMTDELRRNLLKDCNIELVDGSTKSYWKKRSS